MLIWNGIEEREQNVDESEICDVECEKWDCVNTAASFLAPRRLSIKGEGEKE